MDGCFGNGTVVVLDGGGGHGRTGFEVTQAAMHNSRGKPHKPNSLNTSGMAHQAGD